MGNLFRALTKCAKLLSPHLSSKGLHSKAQTRECMLAERRESGPASQPQPPGSSSPRISSTMSLSTMRRINIDNALYSPSEEDLTTLLSIIFSIVAGLGSGSTSQYIVNICNGTRQYSTSIVRRINFYRLYRALTVTADTSHVTLTASSFLPLIRPRHRGSRSS